MIPHFIDIENEEKSGYFEAPLPAKAMNYRTPVLYRCVVNLHFFSREARDAVRKANS